MIAICVQRNWLNTIGNTKDLLWVREETAGVSEYVSLLAGKTTVGLSFVETQLVGRGATESDELFLPAHIPTAVVSGIFDLTRGEAKTEV
jgi:hypothetical protein